MLSQAASDGGQGNSIAIAVHSVDRTIQGKLGRVSQC